MVINSQAPGMKVLASVSTKQAAIEAAKEHQPDLIILDIDLGGISGLDFMPDLLAVSESKILILTAALDTRIHEEALMKGAKGILLKDEPAKVILKAIERIHSGEIWAANDTLAKVLNKAHLSANPQLTDIEKRIALLTRREREIIHALVEFDSSTNEHIAKELFISTSTLKNHLTTIFHKLEVNNRVQLIKFALTHHLAVSPGS